MVVAMLSPFPASAVVDQGEIAIGLRFKGKLADDQFRENLRLGDVQFGVYRKEEVDRVVSDEEIFEYQETEEFKEVILVNIVST